MGKPTMEQAWALLREHFGYPAFHPGQEALIEQILDGRDVLGIMPTGAGKSVCYQIPSLLLPGITVVVSPLISLMKDQVDGLQRMGIPAAYLNSSQTAAEADETYEALAHGMVKLLYIAPERMEAEGFAVYLGSLEVSLVAVDEAHCVSQWGHDFRPSYRRIQDLIGSLPSRPIVGAFTATATQRVRDDILSLLDLRNPFTLTTGFDRANLYFAVHSPGNRDQFVLDYARENGGEPGIVYCLTRKQVDQLTQFLRQSGISALPYHAGLPDGERKANQEAFRDDDAQVVVATNAFGMGIDKSNVRYVIHYGMPKTLENYYQEAGRAGRDGQRSECILLYSSQDIMTNRFLIDHSAGPDGEEDGRDKSGEYRKLQDMINYCNGDGCLRSYILRYFGEKDAPENCANCLNCTEGGEETDITVEAQKILSCVVRMGNRFGTVLVVQVLRGKNNQRIRQMGFEELSTYGIMKDYPEQSIKELISLLVARGYLETRGDEYPVLYAGARAMRFLRERQTLTIKRAIRKTERQSKRRKTGPVDSPLFGRLRELRREIAERHGTAPYLIFSDATLGDMCRILPRSPEEMLRVSGVGRYKLDQYGEEFIGAIREFVEEHGAPPPPPEEPSPPPAESGNRTDTVAHTYELYRQGLSIGDIAAQRGLSVSTVENHLVKARREGHAVDLEPLIPEEYREEILAAIGEMGTDRLKPIKDLLPEEVSYTAIRFAVELYRDRLRESRG